MPLISDFLNHVNIFLSNARSPLLTHFNVAMHGLGESDFRLPFGCTNYTSVHPSVWGAASIQTRVPQAYRSLHPHCTCILESKPMDWAPHGYSGCSVHYIACFLSSICPDS